jgi:hypothetical protein
MRHRHPAFFGWMLELFVATNLSHLVPAITLQLLDDCPAIHRPLLISAAPKYALLHTFSNMELFTLAPKSARTRWSLQERGGCLPRPNSLERSEIAFMINFDLGDLRVLCQQATLGN